IFGSQATDFSQWWLTNTEEDGIQVQLPVYDADVHENYHLYIDLIGADQYQIVDTGWLKDEFSDAGYTNN
ncbi:hypothetical protein DWW42_09245, partial [Limosilactobacillus fermentum]